MFERHELSEYELFESGVGVQLRFMVNGQLTVHS